VLSGVIVATLASCGSNGAARDAQAAARVRADQARGVARQAGLDQQVQDFLARAAAAPAATYTVVYDQGAGQQTTVMSRPPDQRIDVGGEDRVIIKATVTDVCHRAAGRWTCRKGDNSARTGPFTPDAVTQTIGGLVQLSASYAFTVTRRPIAGVDASCLSADRKPSAPADPGVGEHGAMCIAPDGAILALEGTGRPLKAVSYHPSVPSGAFDLPAPPS
jgi:hypothetical protein